MLSAAPEHRGNVTFNAAGNLNLLAAQQRVDQHGINTASMRIGLTFAVYGLGSGATASASRGRGNADGEDVTFSNTRVEAGNTLALQSGGDTTLRGAVARARQVTADILGNLDIESLQDTSVFASRQSSVGASARVIPMDTSSGKWANRTIASATELQRLITLLKKAVASGEMQQYWPPDADFATATAVLDVDENGAWPADYIEWYFFVPARNESYKLTAETYHGLGGDWTRVK
jgi:hypothetical protein